MIYELKDFLRSRFATLLLQTDVWIYRSQSEKGLIQLSVVCVGFHTHKDPFCPMGLFQQVSCRHVSNASGIPYNTQSKNEWPRGPWWPSARGDRWDGYDLES